MTIYRVEVGEACQRHTLATVYRSAEAAMEAYPRQWREEVALTGPMGVWTTRDDPGSLLMRIIAHEVAE